jgi:hypothetical protein
MAALYDLQSAATNTVTEAKTSITLLDQLKIRRDDFRANWEEYIQFLQRCHGYADDYIALCRYASATCSPSQSEVPSRELLADAKQLLRDSQVLRNKHEEALTELRQHKTRLIFMFRRSSTLMIKNKAQLARQGKWLYPSSLIMKFIKHAIAQINYVPTV